MFGAGWIRMGAGRERGGLNAHADLGAFLAGRDDDVVKPKTSALLTWYLNVRRTFSQVLS